ncbi:SRPBCC family protein [Nocardioides nanhaiensis]|uniref:SRPBCC family protein n=1 Tax=Nocardioides nanhaiensis TaxID=1476871 RepID=A0ABP8WSQ4_9ACTN
MQLSRSRTYPCPPEATFDAIMGISLPEVLGHRSGPLPGIVEVREQTTWGSLGDTRRIVLADRSTALETLVEVDRPHRFVYRASELTGPMVLLAEGVEGRFDVEPAGEGGSTVTWSWRIALRGGVVGLAAPLAAPVISRAWQGWARGLLENLEGVLVP